MKQLYNELNEEDVKMMFKKLDTPDMRDDIINAVHGKKKHSPKRLKLRAAAVIAAAAMLTVAVGATAVAVASGEYRMKVTTGDPVERSNPDGSPAILDRFTIDIEQLEADEPGATEVLPYAFSEKALANFEPLVVAAGNVNPKIENTFVTTFRTLEEAEEFADVKLYLPGKFRAHCELVTARGARTIDGNTTLSLNIKAGSRTGETIDVGFGTGSLRVALAGTTEEEPVKFTLPDGTEAQAMLAYKEADAGRNYIAMTYYMHKGMFYNYLSNDYTREYEDDVRTRLVDTIGKTLATATTEPVDPADYPTYEQLQEDGKIYFGHIAFKPTGSKKDNVDGTVKVYSTYRLYYDEAAYENLYLSDKAMENLTPYIGDYKSSNEQPQWSGESVEAAEEFLDMKLRVPEIVRENPVGISIRVSKNGYGVGVSVSMNIHYMEGDLSRLFSINISGTPETGRGATGTTYTEAKGFMLPNGDEAVAVYGRYNNVERYTADVTYLYDGVRYSITIQDTVGGGTVEEHRARLDIKIMDYLASIS